MMWRLPLPRVEGYEINPVDPVLRTDMEGGSPRTRRRTKAQLDDISVSWVFTDADFLAFRVWHDAIVNGGSAWFVTQLALGGVVVDCEARFLEMYKATPRPGLSWVVSAKVQVRRSPMSLFDQLNALGLPSLDLDFAGTKSLAPVIQASIQPTPVVSFTRSTTATYVGADGLIKTAAINEPRFDHDPVTGECKGLLIEEARTNLCPYSDQLNATGWVIYRMLAFGSGSIVDAIVAPDGTLTAEKIVEDATAGVHCVARSIASVPENTVFVWSVYLKASERTLACIEVKTLSAIYPFAYFDLANGVPLSKGAGAINSGMIDVGDGWYRCWVSMDSLSGANPFAVYVIPVIEDGTISYQGDGVSGIYSWGTQLEAGSFPTSYIPTPASSTVTRAADVAQMTGANFSSWYRQEEGTVVCMSDLPVLQPGLSWCISDGNFSSSIYEQPSVSVSYKPAITVRANGITGAAVSGLTATVAGRATITAFAFKLNNVTVAVDGAIGTSDNSVELPMVNKLHVGANWAGMGNHLNGHIARLTYYPKRLSNAELQGLSA